MITKRLLSLAGVALQLLSIGANAGDFATLNFIGFSKDGRYRAYEEYGTQDGSGFPYAGIYFVDVEKNSYAAKSVNVRLENESATEAQARARARRNAAPTIRKFRIVDRNVGKLVVSRLLTDVSANHFYGENPSGEQVINFAEVVGSMYRSGDWDLTMKSIPVKPKGCEYAQEDHQIFMLDVSLYDRERQKTTTLQKDTSLPTGRSCPINYAIQHVYLYESYIAVFINTYYVGFEGPDMRYMVVTGKFK